MKASTPDVKTASAPDVRIPSARTVKIASTRIVNTASADEPRYRFVCATIRLLLPTYFRVRAEGLDRLPEPPYLVCFNHLNWLDPFLLAALWPRDQRLFIFGPAEEDMTRGWKNRLMAWSGIPVAFKPGKQGLVDTTRRAVRVLAAGHVLAIAGEGRLSESEHELMPLHAGPAYFAVRARVPIVPVAVNGTRWLRFGKRLRLRVGSTIPTDGLRADRATVAGITREVQAELEALVRDYPDEEPPGRFGRWLTDVFNERPWLTAEARSLGGCRGGWRND